MNVTAVVAEKVLESKETIMKKLVAVLLLAVASTTSAMAQHHGHGNHGYNRGGHYRGGWIAPAIIGGVIGYGLSRPYYEPYYAPAPAYYPPPVVYSQPQVVQPVCTRYVYQDQYGQVIREEVRCN